VTHQFPLEEPHDQRSLIGRFRWWRAHRNDPGYVTAQLIRRGRPGRVSPGNGGAMAPAATKYFLHD
jgi:hypothetical protein